MMFDINGYWSRLHDRGSDRWILRHGDVTVLPQNGRHEAT